jgi:peptide/nickel transport system substrate-binding protein
VLAFGAIVVTWATCPQLDHNDPPAPAFTVLMDGGPKSVDPRFATSDFSVKLSKLIFSGLVTIDTPDGQPELDLAERIELVGDRVYEITLRDDAVWHDGRPVTAHDVRWTFMTMGEFNSPYAGLAEKIARFDVRDDHHLTIELSESHAPFMTNLAMGIVPRHAVGEDGLLPPDAPMGSGAFRWEASSPQAWVSLTAHDQYHGGRPSLDRVVFRTMPDDNTRLLAMLGGNGDLVQNATAPLMLPVFDDAKELVIETAPSFKYTYLAFNLEHPILRKRAVRQAIAHAIDRDRIITEKFRGTARRARGILAPEHWAYEPDVVTYDFDQEKARQLLDEAGYPDPPGPEPRFKISLKTTTNKFRRSIAMLFSHELAEIGIEVKVRAYEWGTFFGDVKSRNFEMYSMQWPSVVEPDLMAWIFHSKSIPSPENRSRGANRGAYSNAKVDELLEAGRVAHDREDRRQAYGDVQKILAHDLPYISLWHEDNIVVRRASVHGYEMLPNARFRHLAKTRSRQEEPIEATPD